MDIINDIREWCEQSSIALIDFLWLLVTIIMITMILPLLYLLKLFVTEIVFALIDFCDFR